MNYLAKIKTVLLHDSFTQLGGGERVISVLHELFPDSPVYTLVFDKKIAKHFQGWDIRPSVLEYFYRFAPGLKWFLAALPAVIWKMRLPEDTQVILSSSSLFLKAIRKPKGSIHVQYCHTPPRFLWTDFEYVTQEVPFLLRPLVYPILYLMRAWDKRASANVDVFIANSREVQKRIRDFYGRDSVVIYPPIDISFWKPSREKQNYFLLAGRLQAHKGNELIIKIFNDLGFGLHVIGTGRQEEYLKSIAKNNIIFLGRVSDEALRDEYSGAIGYIYPQMEDAGLMPLEAAACGTATIGLARGGSLETIVPGKTGELFERQRERDIRKKIQSWNYKKYQIETLREHARGFDKEMFKKRVMEVVMDAVLNKA